MKTSTRFAAAATLSLAVTPVMGGLIVTEVPGPPSGDSVKIQQLQRDESGPTSFRYYAPRTDAPSKTDDWIYKKGTENGGVDAKYFYRDRDLGQVFKTGPEGFKLGAVTVRLQPVDVRGGGDPSNAKVSIQIMKVTGTPVFNNNGTTRYIDAANATTTSPNGTSNWNGGGSYQGPCTNAQWSTYATDYPNDPNDINNRFRWPSMHFSDDFIEGETYEHVHLASGGIVPDTLDLNDYLRWEFTGSSQIFLEPETKYAILFMFDEPAPDGVNRNIPLSNKNIIPDGTLQDVYPDGHTIRRCGSNQDRENVFIRDVNDPADVEAGRISSEFPAEMEDRIAIPPSTLGYPDVDTYRDLYFIIESADMPGEIEPMLNISKSASPPTKNIIASYHPTPAPNLGGTSIRWRSSGDDDDSGSTFSVPDTHSDWIIRKITFRIGDGIESGANGLPLALDLFKYDGSQNTTGFTGLFHTSGTLPGNLTDGNYITLDYENFDPSSRMLKGGSEYGFLIGSGRLDTASPSADRFRLVSYSSPAATLDPTIEQIRRSGEFDTLYGSGLRPTLANPPTSVRLDQDTVFFVDAVPALTISDIRLNRSANQVTLTWESPLTGPFTILAGSDLSENPLPVIAANNAGSPHTFDLPTSLVDSSKMFFQILHPSEASSTQLAAEQ